MKRKFYVDRIRECVNEIIFSLNYLDDGSRVYIIFSEMSNIEYYIRKIHENCTKNQYILIYNYYLDIRKAVSNEIANYINKI